MMNEQAVEESTVKNNYNLVTMNEFNFFVFKV